MADLDTVAAGGEYLLQRGYRRSWGSVYDIQGSQVFDYWRDPDGFFVEHYADGDCDPGSTGWAPMTPGFQWGRPATADSGTAGPRPSGWRGTSSARSEDGQRVRPEPPRGLLKVATS